MKFFLIILFIQLYSCKNVNQTDCDYIKDYYQKVYQADLEYEKENYAKAYELYQEAFNSCEPINVPGTNELNRFARVCAILGKNDLSLKFIQKIIERGYEISWSQQESIFDTVFTTEQGKEFVANYDKLRQEALSNLNLKLREEIKEMKREDQKYRNGSYRENIDKQEAIDEKNTQKIIEIFNEFGYPNESIIGSFSVDKTPVNITAMLLPTSDSIRINYFIPKLKEFVKNGTCPPEVLGTVIDQYYLYNGEPQIYGTYKNQNGEYADMISDLKKVDDNRISIGLPPLELKEKKDSILRKRYSRRF